MGWDPEQMNPPQTQAESAQKLLAQYHVASLTNCSTCHR